MRLGAEPLLADLYEFIMAHGFWREKPTARGSFNYFVRRAPFGGKYVVLAGVEPLLEALETLRFSEEDLDYLSSLEFLSRAFIEELRSFRFDGEVSCASEGELVFPGEPVLRVESSLMSAQLIAGLVLTHLNFQSAIATKAARIVDAAGGKPVVELGVRRAHGLAGSAVASRAAYLAGVAMTSNVLAGKLFGVPVAGTMAHSWVMSFPSEREAFEAFARVYPRRCTLLIDTYGVAEGLRNAIPVLQSLARQGGPRLGVRLDSGDPIELVGTTRHALDSAGLAEVDILLSGDLDEHRIAELIRADVPVDIWGVGSQLATAADDPALSGVYKLGAVCEDGVWNACMKLSDSPDKASLPGINNVLRSRDGHGALQGDVIVPESELAAEQAIRARMSDGSVEPLLRPRMTRGRRLEAPPPTSEIRDRARVARERLPAPYRQWDAAERYPVTHAAAITALCGSLMSIKPTPEERTR